MKTYKTCAKDKQTKEYTVITSEYPTKAEFIKDVRRNGYSVNAKRVWTEEMYDWHVANDVGEFN